MGITMQGHRSRLLKHLPNVSLPLSLSLIHLSLSYLSLISLSHLHLAVWCSAMGPTPRSRPRPSTTSSATSTASWPVHRPHAAPSSSTALSLSLSLKHTRASASRGFWCFVNRFDHGVERRAAEERWLCFCSRVCVRPALPLSTISLSHLSQPLCLSLSLCLCLSLAHCTAPAGANSDELDAILDDLCHFTGADPVEVIERTPAIASVGPLDLSAFGSRNGSQPSRGSGWQLTLEPVGDAEAPLAGSTTASRAAPPRPKVRSTQRRWHAARLSKGVAGVPLAPGAQALPRTTLERGSPRASGQLLQAHLHCGPDLAKRSAAHDAGA